MLFDHSFLPTTTSVQFCRTSADVVLLFPNAACASLWVCPTPMAMTRSAMLRGLAGVSGGQRAIPFVRMFYGAPSVYLWEDDHGVVHNIHQAEGGEQGDALMPLLFSLGQHAALVAVQSQLIPGEN